MAKFVKKCLTIGKGYANICKLSDERLRNSPEERKIMKISEKQVKKGLTNWKLRDRIKKFNREQQA